MVRQSRIWFLLLFASVSVVNIGYTLLSLSSCLEMALWANRIAYLGSVFLPLSMLMILLNVTNSPYRKRLPGALLGIAFCVFLITASPGILDIYYKEVSFGSVNGVSVLNKVYGPLHPIYLLYLLGYFTAMIAVIVHAKIKQRIDTTIHAFLLALAVLVNIGVWLVEQLTHIDFEMLSISYIISESFLLIFYLVMRENQRLQEIAKQVAVAQMYAQTEEHSTKDAVDSAASAQPIDSLRLEAFMDGLTHLTPTEKTIYEAYIARATTKEVLAMLDIKENTLKYHNKNLYSKLGVSSRKELLEIHKYLKSVNVVCTDQESA